MPWARCPGRASKELAHRLVFGHDPVEVSVGYGHGVVSYTGYGTHVRLHATHQVFVETTDMKRRQSA